MLHRFSATKIVPQLCRRLVRSSASMSGNVAVTVVKQEAGEFHLSVVDTPLPTPKQGEVLVRITCRPVHFADVWSIQGRYAGFKPKSLPAVPGLEGVGTVERNGDGCSLYQPGQRVTWAYSNALLEGRGSWQQFCCIEEDCLYAVSDKLSDESASQFHINVCSAYGLLARLAAPKGAWILQNAAGSVMGRQIIQIAKHQGLNMISLVRRHEQVQELKDTGAELVLCTEDEDWAARVQSITGGKLAYGAVDAVAGEMTSSMVKAVREDGTIVVYGALTGPTVTVPVLDLVFDGKVVCGFLLKRYITSLGDKRRAVLEEILALMESGVIKPFNGRSFQLAEAREAIDEALKPARGGKCFIKG